MSNLFRSYEYTKSDYGLQKIITVILFHNCKSFAFYRIHRIELDYFYFSMSKTNLQVQYTLMQ